MVVPFGLLVLYSRRSRPVGSLSLPQRMEMLLAQTLFVWYVKTSVLGCTVSVTVWQ